MRSFLVLKTLAILVPGAAAALAQPVSGGLKAGVPLTDFINTVQNVSSSVPNRYIIGVMGELRLPFGLGVEADALYRRVNYSDQLATTTDHTTANSWEFPIVLKYRFPTRIARPYVEAGIAWDTLSGVTDTVTQFLASTVSSKPAALANNTTTGFVIGAGLDVHALVIHISPELRYTRWTDPHFNLAGILSSNQNQAEFLVGITF